MTTRFESTMRATLITPLGVVWLLLAGAALGQAAIGLQCPTYNNRLDGQRFSPLREITLANATQLGEVCRVQIDGPTLFSAGLIVVDGVIYTATGRETVAIDAATCAARWRSAYVPEDDEIGGKQYVAFASGNVLRNTFGALGLPSVVVMSLNAKAAAAQGHTSAAVVSESAFVRQGVGR